MYARPSISVTYKFCFGMKALFDIVFGVVKFTFKATFWIIGVVIALLIGSCPD
jgi:hypothetical protein